MRRLLVWAVVLLAAVFFVPGCSGSSAKHHHPFAAAARAQRTPVVGCTPKSPAVAGACAPRHQLQAAAKVARASVHASGVLTMHGSIGPDVSHYQGCPVNAARIRRSGATFMIAALGDGFYVDRCAPANLRAARNAGLLTGAYLFMRPGSSSPEAQADRMAGLARAAGPVDMPLWQDDEANRPGMTVAQKCSWTARAADRLEHDMHRIAGIYTGAWWADPNVGPCRALSVSPTFGPRPLWVSGYAISPLVPLAWIAARATWALWQFTGDNAGPWYPHCIGGYCGVDISVMRAMPVARASVSKHVRGLCREYAHYRRMARADRRDGRHRLSPAKRARSVRVRATLAKHRRRAPRGYRCSLKGVAVRR